MPPPPPHSSASPLKPRRGAPQQQDSGDDKPFQPHTPTALTANSSSNTNKSDQNMPTNKRPLQKKKTGASSETQRIRNTSHHSVNQQVENDPAPSSNNGQNDTTKLPRKPERSTSTDQPLMAPSRTKGKSSRNSKRRTEPVGRNADLEEQALLPPPVPQRRTTTAEALTQKKSSFTKADDKMKRQHTAKEGGGLDELLASSQHTTLDRDTTTNTVFQRQSRVVSQTVFANNHSDDEWLESDQRLKVDLRREQQEQADLQAAKSASSASYIQAGDNALRSNDNNNNYEGNQPAPVDHDAISVPAAVLRRTRHSTAPRRVVSEPGAYRGNPGEGFQRATNNWKETYHNRSTEQQQQQQQHSREVYDDEDLEGGTNVVSVSADANRNPPPSLLATTLSNPANNPDKDDDEDDELVEAKLVHEVIDYPPGTVPIAKPVDEYQWERKQRRHLWWVGVLLILFSIITIGLIVGLIIRSQRIETIVYETRSPTAMPTTGPTMAPTPFIISGLPEYTQQSILSSPTSPQAKAYQWIRNDPKLQDYPQKRHLQRFALATLYFATSTPTDDSLDLDRDGANLSLSSSWNITTGWLDYDVPECEWYPNVGFPIDCDDQGLYLQLQLGDNLLRGSLPPEIGLLLSLTDIDIANNQIHGPLPTEIGLLTNVGSLLLHNNTLSGSLPTELGLLTSMQRVHMFDNGLTGHLPTEIGLMSYLTEWHMYRTNISGPLPTHLGQLNFLQDLLGWNTKLTGTLPTEIGRMVGLQSMALHNGILRGTIPTEFGLLTKLSHLQLDVHNFSGTIPSELGQLKSIAFLSFGNNQLVSTLPTELGLLNETLRALRFYQNQLTGRIPTELGNLVWMERLELDSNQLSHGIPSELGILSSRLARLFFSKNQLTGGLPSELGSLSQLEALTLDNNIQLGGSIPEEWNELGSPNGDLKELFLSGVDITGTIPSGLCTLERLQIDCDADVCGCDCGVC